MTCSACKAEMKEVVVDGVTIDRCERCGGVWLDAGEAEELAKKTKPGKDALKKQKYEVLKQWKSAAQDPKPTDRACPRCEEPLSRVNYKDIPGLHVDACRRKDCGLYLDRGELEKIRLVG